MPSFSLIPHPLFPPKRVKRVEAGIRRSKFDIEMIFRVVGSEEVLWPEPARAERLDGLWRTTCFELFVAGRQEPHYSEYNFSPSTAWAAYDFSSYRTGMRDRVAMVNAVIDRLVEGIHARCEFVSFGPGPVRIGLSAVVEELGGTKSYWALAHAPGAPDFHNPACFTTVLAPAAAPWNWASTGCSPTPTCAGRSPANAWRCSRIRPR